MKPIEITESISITKCRSTVQRCIECQNAIGKGTVAFNFHNYNDGLVLKKNVWLHINCYEALFKRLREYMKKNGAEVGAQAI